MRFKLNLTIISVLIVSLHIACSNDSITNADEETEEVTETEAIQSPFYIDTQGEIDLLFDVETYEVEFRQLKNEFGYTFTSNTNSNSFSGTQIYYEFSPTPEENELTRLLLNIDLPNKLLAPGEYEIYDHREIEVDANHYEGPISKEFNTMGLLVNLGYPDPWTRGYLAENGILEIYTDSVGRKAGIFSGKFSKVWDSESNSIQNSDTLKVNGKFYIKNL